MQQFRQKVYNLLSKEERIKLVNVLNNPDDEGDKWLEVFVRQIDETEEHNEV
mgnify:CR=1 FL=1